MVDEPALRLSRLRVSLDVLPVHVREVARAIPRTLLLPAFASLTPQMIVPYADAASLMLANLDRDNPMARHRVGLALPVGMRGRNSGLLFLDRLIARNVYTEAIYQQVAQLQRCHRRQMREEA
jgi:hypothetical protein